MKTSEVLLAARELIATPEKWTQFASARDSSGEVVPTSCADAVCWCLVGAVTSVLPSHDCDRELVFLRRSARIRKHMAVSSWNDSRGRTHAEVLEALTKAAALAAAEEQS